MRRVSMAPRDELLAAVAERYRSSPRADKARIADEFTAVTGYHRKHAMRLLRTSPSEPVAARQRRRLYDEADRDRHQLGAQPSKGAGVHHNAIGSIGVRQRPISPGSFLNEETRGLIQIVALQGECRTYLAAAGYDANEPM